MRSRDFRLYLGSQIHDLSICLLSIGEYRNSWFDFSSRDTCAFFRFFSILDRETERSFDRKRDVVF